MCSFVGEVSEVMVRDPLLALSSFVYRLIESLFCYYSASAEVEFVVNFKFLLFRAVGKDSAETEQITFSCLYFSLPIKII